MSPMNSEESLKMEEGIEVDVRVRFGMQAASKLE